MKFFTTLLSIIIFALWIFILAILVTEDNTIKEPLLDEDNQSIFRTNPKLFPPGKITCESLNCCKAEFSLPSLEIK